MWVTFEIKDLGGYHNDYVQGNTLLSTDAFDNLRDMFLKIFESDPPHFYSAPGSSMISTLK